MSFWATAMVAANSAVTAPITAIIVLTHGEAAAITGFTRVIR